MFLCARSTQNLNIDFGNICTFYTFYSINIQYKCGIVFMQAKMHLSKLFWGLSSALITNFTLEITPGTPVDQLIGWILAGAGCFYFFVRGL